MAATNFYHQGALHYPARVHNYTNEICQTQHPLFDFKDQCVFTIEEAADMYVILYI